MNKFSRNNRIIRKNGRLKFPHVCIKNQDTRVILMSLMRPNDDIRNFYILRNIDITLHIIRSSGKVMAQWFT